MPNGMNTARKLKRNRKKQVFKKDRRKPIFRLGSCQANGIVTKLDELEAKQPNSGKRKIARVQLVKNGEQVSAYIPGDNGYSYIEEHDTVTLEGIGGSKGKSKGDLPCIRFKVVKVQGISLKEMVKGKIQKPTRR